jgi:mannose-6-phosphate isomerase-like protein (cupin superfamily)
MTKINLSDKLSKVQEFWKPAIVAELNGHHVKLVKFKGEFVWHHHDAEDEMFLVLHGSFRMEYRDMGGHQLSIEIGEGEFIVIPKGMEHRPVAAEEVHVMLFEPTSTLNTGNVRNAMTVESLPSI